MLRSLTGSPTVPWPFSFTCTAFAEVIVIDEIGTEAECLAARTIAQRGVQLVATAHGEGA